MNAREKIGVTLILQKMVLGGFGMCREDL